jgi:hypothetical protein
MRASRLSRGGGQRRDVREPGGTWGDFASGQIGRPAARVLPAPMREEAARA